MYIAMLSNIDHSNHNNNIHDVANMQTNSYLHIACIPHCDILVKIYWILSF